MDLSWSDPPETQITPWDILFGAEEANGVDKAAQAKVSAAWLALMTRTYSALIQKNSPHFKHLEHRQFILKKISIFSNAAFHSFLGHLEQLTISLCRGDILGEWIPDVIPDYSVVITKLDENFFKHLAKATNLSIKAQKEAPLGPEGRYHASLIRQAHRIPMLSTLNLDNIFVSRDLINFIVGHKNTLVEVNLNTCYADPTLFGTDRDINRIYWSELFTSVVSACPEKLRRFALISCEMPFPEEEPLDDIDKKEIDKVRNILQQDPGRLFFAYAFLDGLEGKLVYDNEMGFAQFLRGWDQQSLDQLMTLVERNMEAAKTHRLQLQVEALMADVTIV